MWRLLFVLPALSSLLSAATCIAVEGREIVAKDVAKVDPAFAAVNPDLPFSYAPRIGAQRIIPVSDLAHWGARAGVETTSTSSACFERPAHNLSVAEIRTAVQRVFPESDIVQIDVLEVCKCNVPAGRLDFTVEGASAPPFGHPDVPVLWRGQIWSASGSPYPVWASVRVLAKSSVVRLRQDLRAGEAIRQEALEQIVITDSPVRLRRPDSAGNYVGKVVNRNACAGTYLDPSVVAPLPEVTRGSTVTVEVVNGATRLELKARAETPGHTGDTVVLTNPSGLGRFRATVTGPGAVQIALSPAPRLYPSEKNGNKPTTTSGRTL
jgi:flagella basal body P-ring formation protein FlgA